MVDTAYARNFRIYSPSSFRLNQVPTCLITASTYMPNPSETVTFYSNASDPDNDPLAYFWEFGDGTTSSEANPTHAYGSSGTYSVSLYVSDNYENSVISNATINVQGGGGGGGGGIPIITPFVEEVVQPSKNILFKPLFWIGPIPVYLIILLIAIAVLARYKKQHGIEYSMYLIVGFLVIFGSRLGIVL